MTTKMLNITLNYLNVINVPVVLLYAVVLIDVFVKKQEQELSCGHALDRYEFEFVFFCFGENF